MPELIVIRGTPGSGKSTLAKQLAAERGALHIEADMFFVGDDGVYRWDKDKLHLAHKWCFKQAGDAIASGRPVVLSNTSTRVKEFYPYIEIAEAWGYKTRVIRMTKQYGSIHNVPEATIKAMIDRMQPYPGEEIYP